MRICTDAIRLAFAAGQTVSLYDAIGTRITCLSGALWITQENEGRDIVLNPGKEVTLDRKGKTVIYAVNQSLGISFESREAAPDTPWWRRLGHAWLCHCMELGVRCSAWRRAYRF
jgi:hypothetical protein